MNTTIKLIDEAKEKFAKAGYKLEKINGHNGTGYYALKIGDPNTMLNWKFISSSLDGTLNSIILLENDKVNK